MIFLEAFKAMRIEASFGARISCRSGVLWVTQEGDLRDLIVAHGESLEVKGGVTVAVALEPTVMTVVEHGTSSWLQDVLAGVRTAARGLRRSISRSSHPRYDAPYVSPYL
jgi:hypothetical protein